MSTARDKRRGGLRHGCCHIRDFAGLRPFGCGQAGQVEQGQDKQRIAADSKGEITMDLELLFLLLDVVRDHAPEYLNVRPVLIDMLPDMQVTGVEIKNGHLVLTTGTKESTADE